MNLRPHDPVVIAHLAVLADQPVSQMEVGLTLCISAAEISNALTRANYGHLFDPGDRKDKRRGRLGNVRISNLCEFIVHGVKYAFPGRLGEIAIGLPTAWGAPPLASTVVPGNNGVPVWPDADGAARGMAIEPLYAAAPRAARQDANVYQLMALIDALRVGGARERGLAADLITKKLGGK